MGAERKQALRLPARFAPVLVADRAPGSLLLQPLRTAAEQQKDLGALARSDYIGVRTEVSIDSHCESTHVLIPECHYLVQLVRCRRWMKVAVGVDVRLHCKDAPEARSSVG
jgi:hypothetical protein